MRTSWIWSIGLGRWWGVHVRLHIFFVLFAALILFVDSTVTGVNEPTGLGHLVVITLLVSVILHELGHIFVARHLGGLAEEMVIGPLGGLSPVRVPFEPHSELVAMMAGGLVNVAVCLLCALGLSVAAYQGADPSSTNLSLLLNPLTPDLSNALPISILSGMKVVFWVNWCLLLVNLIPAFPFDGGRMLRSVCSFLWPEIETRQATALITRLGKVLAAVLLVAAWLTMGTTAESTHAAAFPLWLVCTLLAIFLFFNAQREEMQQQEIDDDDDTVFGYDFSQGYTSLERSIDDEDDQEEDASASRSNVKSPLGLVGHWMERRRESSRQREIEQEADDERRVDEILRRLHELGMPALSMDDRALLNRVSERYRSRHD